MGQGRGSTARTPRRARRQFSYFDGKKTIVRNYALVEAAAPLNELFDFGFAGIHLETAAEAIDIRTSKKGKVFVGRQKVGARPAAVEPHNRAKDVPLPEGQASGLLEAMGIAAADGRVRPGMRAKFTQINEFLKHLLHVFGDAGLREARPPARDPRLRLRIELPHTGGPPLSQRCSRNCRTHHGRRC